MAQDRPQGGRPLPTSLSKRTIRRQQVEAALIAGDGTLRAVTINAVHELPELRELGRIERWIGLLDLQASGIIRLEQIVSTSDMAIRSLSPTAQRSLLEDARA